MGSRRGARRILTITPTLEPSRTETMPVPQARPTKMGGIEAYSALTRAVALLAQRVVALEAAIVAGNENAWGAYCDAVRSLTAVLPHATPGGRGGLLTTREMAERLNITPKTLLRHRARGEVRAAVAAGKLIRWRGDEVPGYRPARS